VNASINNVGSGTVTVYAPAGTANNETAVNYASFGSAGLSIISGNSMGTSFASTNATFPNASAVSFGICNQANSDTPTGYNW
jgi:hypothetical protein